MFGPDLLWFTVQVQLLGVKCLDRTYYNLLFRYSYEHTNAWNGPNLLIYYLGTAMKTQMFGLDLFLCFTIQVQL